MIEAGFETTEPRTGTRTLLIKGAMPRSRRIEMLRAVRPSAVIGYLLGSTAMLSFGIGSAAAQVRADLWQSGPTQLGALPNHGGVSIDLPADQNPPMLAPVENLISGGVLGGVLGFYVGLFLGTQAGGSGSDAEYVGAVIGESLLLPLGVHLANRQRGSYTTSATYSVAAAVVGMAGVGIVAGPFWLLIPATQLYLSIRTERLTSVDRD